MQTTNASLFIVVCAINTIHLHCLMQDLFFFFFSSMHSLLSHSFLCWFIFVRFAASISFVLLFYLYICYVCYAHAFSLVFFSFISSSWRERVRYIQELFNVHIQCELFCDKQTEKKTVLGEERTSSPAAPTILFTKTFFQFWCVIRMLFREIEFTPSHIAKIFQQIAWVFMSCWHTFV